MKFLLILIIKAYWVLIPESKRRSCLFRISCSRYVYETTMSKGFYKGFRSLVYRMKNCKHGYHIIENYTDNRVTMILPNGDILEQNEISKRFLNK
ncbi:membrane protein insertion efficiency factor YidD [Elizabethkingia sp. HX QKY]|uniref:membrane protein insertion efficiency factor YidD n=1 Tax=Elizabethkingia TaxID=308865 RepID=UPI002A24A44E|nr:membrane protein insertion efficiency factor YidD [Elizabethkingia sp. HX QKY]MDX8570333.1 membrane protein insertion efficiency factor YidD [Elizabethkingia sp. HX QKY]